MITKFIFNIQIDLYIAMNGGNNTYALKLFRQIWNEFIPEICGHDCNWRK